MVMMTSFLFLRGNDVPDLFLSFLDHFIEEVLPFFWDYLFVEGEMLLFYLVEGVEVLKGFWGVEAL